MTPQVSDQLFLYIVAGSFLAVCVSLVFAAVGVWAMRVALVAFGVLYFLSSYQFLSFNIQMAHAFNSNDTSGDGIRYIYFPLLFAYYAFALVTCFTRPPDARWFVPVVLLSSPLVAFWQQSGMFATAMLPYRALHAFCFVLLWLRIYDLRRRAQPNQALQATAAAPGS